MGEKQSKLGNPNKEVTETKNSKRELSSSNFDSAKEGLSFNKYNSDELVETDQARAQRLFKDNAIMAISRQNLEQGRELKKLKIDEHYELQLRQLTIQESERLKFSVNYISKELLQDIGKHILANSDLAEKPAFKKLCEQLSFILEPNDMNKAKDAYKALEQLRDTMKDPHHIPQDVQHLMQNDSKLVGLLNELSMAVVDLSEQFEAMQKLKQPDSKRKDTFELSSMIGKIDVELLSNMTRALDDSNVRKQYIGEIKRNFQANLDNYNEDSRKKRQLELNDLEKQLLKFSRDLSRIIAFREGDSRRSISSKGAEAAFNDASCFLSGLQVLPSSSMENLTAKEAAETLERLHKKFRKLESTLGDMRYNAHSVGAVGLVKNNDGTWGVSDDAPEKLKQVVRIEENLKKPWWCMPEELSEPAFNPDMLKTAGSDIKTIIKSNDIENPIYSAIMNGEDQLSWSYLKNHWEKIVSGSNKDEKLKLKTALIQDTIAWKKAEQRLGSENEIVMLLHNKMDKSRYAYGNLLFTNPRAASDLVEPYIKIVEEQSTELKDIHKIYWQSANYALMQKALIDRDKNKMNIDEYKTINDKNTKLVRDLEQIYRDAKKHCDLMERKRENNHFQKLNQDEKDYLKYAIKNIDYSLVANAYHIAGRYLDLKQLSNSLYRVYQESQSNPNVAMAAFKAVEDVMRVSDIENSNMSLIQRGGEPELAKKSSDIASLIAKETALSQFRGHIKELRNRYSIQKVNYQEDSDEDLLIDISQFTQD